MSLFKTSHLYFLMPILLIGISCQQTDLSPETVAHSNLQLSGIPESRISVEEGILVFKNQQDFQQTLSMLRSMDIHEVEAWGKDKGFLSQQLIYEQVIAAEEAVEEKAFGKYSQLSEDAFLALNLPDPEHSGLYESALRKGLLKVVEDSDTAHTYYLSLFDPTVADVINEEGFVMIGDTLTLYTNIGLKRWIGGTIDQRTRIFSFNETDIEKGIYVSSFAENSSRTWINRSVPMINTSFQLLQPNDHTWFTNNKRRCRYRVVCVTDDYNNSPAYLVDVFYFLYLEAERKKWGNWKKRNSYRPTFTINGNWDIFYQLREDSAPLNCVTFTSVTPPTGRVPSPMVNRTYFGNDFNYLLNPHASWTPSYPYDNFCVPIQVPEYTFTVTANGDGGPFFSLGTKNWN